MNWFEIKQPEISWLVGGLIPSDGHAAICGKPKAGKSTLTRNLIAAVIKGRDFLDRSIGVQAGTGRVLYIHLDRKDQPWRVAKELRDLGVTEEESSRLVLRTAADLPAESFSERIEWLQKEVIEAKPHMVVIDLLWQFIIAKNSNDYNEVLSGINALQDALTSVKYRGALVVTVHGRKATNPNDLADDILGSTGQRGSFSTLIIMTRHRPRGVYTIMSDQTERDDEHGEIDETEITRSADGILTLARPFCAIVKEERVTKDEVSLQRVLDYIMRHPGCEITEIVDSLGMAKKTVLKLLGMTELLRITGAGVRGDPHRYHLADDECTPAQAATQVASAFL